VLGENWICKYLLVAIPPVARIPHLTAYGFDAIVRIILVIEVATVDKGEEIEFAIINNA
jgi:hypothetical protein